VGSEKSVSARGWARTLAFGLACGALCAAAATAQPHDKAPPPAAPHDLNDALRPIVERHHLPALAVIAMHGGEVVASGAIGVRRAGKDEPVTADDRWHIGSCAKSMTATLAARLVEAGTIRWDTTIGESLGKIDALRESILPAYHDVTLRQLLAHRSGLPEDRDPDPTLWPKVLALKGSMIEQRRDTAALVLSREPAAAPGSTMAYSNFGYVVAATMMEQATGQPWEELIRLHLFEPLGITSAGFGAPGGADEDGEKASQPRGHRLLNGTRRPIEPAALGSDNPPTLRPAGGVHLSLRDWAKYAAAHVAGHRGQDTPLLKAESWKILHADEYRQDYALGWALGQRDWAGGTVLSHDGSNGLWMAVIWLAPQRDLAVMAVTNCGDAGASTGCDEAVVAALQALDLLPPPR